MASNYDKQVDIGKSYFLKYDQEKLAVKFHLEMDERYLYLTYIGTPCRIERATGTVYEKNGEVYTECRSYETVMTIYDMLCHSSEPELPPLGRKWTLVANFAAAGASPSADVFSQKYADYFTGKVEELKQSCIRLGGQIKPRLAGADVTAEIPAFPFFPVWFNSGTLTTNSRHRSKSCGTNQTMRYLNFETTYYLQGDLLERLKMFAWQNHEMTKTRRKEMA